MSPQSSLYGRDSMTKDLQFELDEHVERHDANVVSKTKST